MGENLGYVTTYNGRKRRLPELQLDKYDFFFIDNPDEYVPDEIAVPYIKRLNKTYFRNRQAIIDEAYSKGIKIVQNEMKIADAKRQAVNARIQGSASELTKLAIISVGRDKRLRELGFKLLLPIHDEILAECPIENARECKERFARLMIEAGKDLRVPSKCDVACSYCWYGEEIDV